MSEYYGTPDAFTQSMTPTVAGLKRWAKANHDLAMTVAKATAFAQVERERVEAYVEPLFATFGFVDDEGKPVTHSRRLYLCNDDTRVAEFFAACDVAHRANGYQGEEGTCPALVAEELQRKAEQLLLDSLGRFAGVDGGDYNRTLELRAKALELALGCTLSQLR